MKNRKYMSGLLIGLLSLCGCTFDAANSSNSSSAPANSSDVSNSTQDSNKENYFNDADKELLEDYFGFVLPSLNLDYTLEDYSDYLGYTCVVICFDNASEDDFLAYRDMLGEKFTFVEEGEYESDYWYIYQEGNFSIETCYDDYSESVPFIYVQVYDTSNLDDGSGDTGSDDVTVKETVNGYFDAEDSALLDSYFSFETPCVGDS